MTFTELKQEWDEIMVRREDLLKRRPGGEGAIQVLIDDSSGLRAAVGLILDKLAEQEKKNT